MEATDLTEETTESVDIEVIDSVVNDAGVISFTADGFSVYGIVGIL